MASVPDAFQDLFEKRTIAHVATVGDEQTPHVTPVWVDYDAEDERILVNTERARRKVQNIEDDPAVGVSMTDPDNPYRRLSVMGEVDELTTDGAREHIDELARRYTDADEYQMPIESERVILRIRIDEVVDAQDSS
ncbi:pyridoxamine 5'-phosphate oxidase family protein [Natronorubrum daqingense]|uniref:PPOX class F420-dependent enzyme n=1 Tax=Natronorubrum daqingense TaxID=588898 RepID=A0A1N6ZUC7_9EURY|nr:TIGR03618 family F420-dependent PPOX class oxidoreductase [Natronorubrum daqingense]APX95246.1 PPOX class F420-dependent enzyme [Natronorubrum daqingense]SIR30385.1 PPOX class probable F420-dependent enzyme [Natronorubrum daqingense]